MHNLEKKFILSFDPINSLFDVSFGYFKKRERENIMITRWKMEWMMLGLACLV